MLKRLLLILAACLSLGASEPKQIVGWIEGFDGPRDAYRILRNGQELRIALFMPIEAGDQLVVRNPDGRLLVAVDGGRVIEEVRQDRRITVTRQRGTVPTVVTNLLQWASGWFTERHQEHLSVPVSVHVRGARPLLPLLDALPPRVAAGTRPLSVGWRTGQPPYAVRLTRADDMAGQPVISASGLTEPRTQLAPMALVPGRYILSVEDSAGQRGTASFFVVEGSQVPEPAPSAMTALPSGPLRTTLLAARLASLDDGVWRLEAYQLVAPLAEAYHPAQLLRDALEQGVAPAR